MEGTEIDDQVRSSCVYPRDMLNDIGFFFGMGRMATPIVIFADGATVIGWNDQDARMLLQEKIKDQIFYPTVEARGSNSQR
jgi:protein disulfide-isomerase